MQRLMSSFLFLALLTLSAVPVQAQHTKDSLEVIQKRIKEKKAILYLKNGFSRGFAPLLK